MEQKLNKFNKNKPTVWLRYVDDIYCLFTIPQGKIIEFHTRAHKWHKNLHFTITTKSNKSISFLDVLVTRDEHQLITSLYRKPSHAGLCLLWDSSQNRKYKVGLIRTLVLCIYRICCKKEMDEKELNEPKNASNDWIPIAYY